jgi:FtsP/CotA-like multicopper oxidase with cupredoxin domain
MNLWNFRRVSAMPGRSLICVLVLMGTLPHHAQARTLPSEACPRPLAGSVVPGPFELRSQNGTLKVSLTYLNYRDAGGKIRYCYIDAEGHESPLLRLKPGDLLILNLKNQLTLSLPDPAVPMSPHGTPMKMKGACGGGEMNSLSTNLHFHGLTIPPICHQDDVLSTLVPSRGPTFEYRFRIPADEAPGMYWYHPHVHGFSSAQVLGGASGALLIDGIERYNPRLAGLPERVFVIRDQDLVNPDAPLAASGNVPAPTVLKDNEGDILNTGTDGGKPAKDLSINFVPVAYPRYTPGLIRVKPGARELWRVLNASAITYLNLQILANNAPKYLGVVSLDGCPINQSQKSKGAILWESHILLPPAGRAEFIVQGLPAGGVANLVTRNVDTGPAGENDPTRPLAAEPAGKIPAATQPLSAPRFAWLGDVQPVTERKLYFSEKPLDPASPQGPTEFFITVDGQTPAPFDPMAKSPNITVHQGDVEDWVVENRTQELHAFHIHQTHFILIEWNGVPVYEPYLRDTVNVPYWDGKSRQYPSVKLRMDFRDPNTVGTFLFHCHLLEHEDGGMMGTIRVLPRLTPPDASTPHFNHAATYQ